MKRIIHSSITLNQLNVKVTYLFMVETSSFFSAEFSTPPPPLSSVVLLHLSKGTEFVNDPLRIGERTWHIIVDRKR